MQIGYARVSTQDQDLRMQYDALGQVRCDKIYEDKASGVKTSREGLKLALETVREGDCLVVWKLDRLGRSVKDLVAIVCDLEQRGVHFISLTDQIDTSTTAGRFFFHVMASLAQMERDLTAERTRAGLDAARRQGRTGGRRRKMDRFKNSYCNAATAGRRAPAGSGKRPGRIYPDTVSMAAGITEDGDGRCRHRYTEVKSIR